jgi:methylenetetrahydrofolate reductase (NADPH)
MAGGQPPGCWVSPALLAAVRAESRAPDRGRRARLERAARTVAVLRGLGYAGAYIGGTHDADQVSFIIRRAAELAPRWEELAADLHYCDPAGIYLYADAGAPVGAHVNREAGSGRWFVPWVLDVLGRLFPVSEDTWLRRLGRRLAAWADRRPPVARAVERLELAVKQPLFGCQACGNCVLGHLEYVCPQTCPKQLRNGPCGGTTFGRCEVVDQSCVWTRVYARAKAADRVRSLVQYVPPPDRSLTGTSSWINYFLDRDHRPGREAAPAAPANR